MAKRKKRKANEVNKNKIIREFYENGAIVSDCNYGKKRSVTNGIYQKQSLMNLLCQKMKLNC